MYLKNVSKNTTASINTKVGKICIRPGEVICLNEKVFSPLAPSLRQATEEEYLSFRNPDKEIENNIEEQNDQPVAGTDKDDTVDERIKDADLKIKAIDALKTELADKEDLTKEDIDSTLDKISTEIKDEGTIDFIKSLFKFNLMADKPDVDETATTVEVEEPEQKKPEEKAALKVQKTTDAAEKELLEQQIADLKESWAKAKQPRKKERIYKEIQELQKQIDKL